MFVDCVHIKIHRSKSVPTEAFHVALAVTENGMREVLGIFNMPVESATGWGEIFDELKARSVQRVSLIVADGITGLDSVVGNRFPGTSLQRCMTHLKQNFFCQCRRHGLPESLAAGSVVAVNCGKNPPLATFFAFNVTFSPFLRITINQQNTIRYEKEFLLFDFGACSLRFKHFLFTILQSNGESCSVFREPEKGF